MKQKILMLLAVVLLSSANAFAQSGNSEPLKGDVNGDGVVDVADIAAIIDIMANGGGPVSTTTYYWYVGTTQPTDPTDSAQNTGLNKWTSLGTTLPTSSIKVVKEDPTYVDHTWYIAAPTAANLTLYNATNVASNEAGWSKSTFDVGSVSYTLWTSKGQSDQAVGYLHKQTTYYSYVGTDLNELLVEEETGNLKSNIATQIKSIAGVKTYTYVPSSLETGITINAGQNYVYVIAPTSTLNNASIYLTNTSGGTIVTETLGTFSIDSTEYTVKCTPSEVGTVLTAWK